MFRSGTVPPPSILNTRRNYAIIYSVQARSRAPYGTEWSGNMLDANEKAVLSLLCAGIGRDGKEFGAYNEAELDPSRIAKLLASGGVVTTVYDKLDILGTGIGAKLRGLLEQSYYAAVTQAMLQDSEGKRMLAAFEAAGMDCIPLKGWELRELYPDITRRTMADIDILIRDLDYAAVASVMKGLGYAAEGDSSWKHVDFTRADIGVTAELHRRLTDDSGAVMEWEETIFSGASPVPGHEHLMRMNDEDFYTFHVLHLHKDLLNGRIGLKRILDTRLYLDAHPELDRALLEDRFERMGVGGFARSMEKLSAVCFADEAMDEDSELLIGFALSSGVFGTEETYKLGRITRMASGSVGSGKLRSVLAAVFLPYPRMKAQFPKLKKAPFLLPYYWCVRLFNLRSGLKAKLKRLDYSGIGEEDRRYMQEVFRAAGVSGRSV